MLFRKPRGNKYCILYPWWFAVFRKMFPPFPPSEACPTTVSARFLRLTEQHRMHPKLAEFPSNHFYQAKIIPLHLQLCHVFESVQNLKAVTVVYWILYLICVHIYIYVYMYIYIYVYINMYIYICTYIYTYVYIYMYICIFIHIYTYVYIYIYIYTYTRKRAAAPSRRPQGAVRPPKNVGVACLTLLRNSVPLMACGGSCLTLLSEAARNLLQIVAVRTCQKSWCCHTETARHWRPEGAFGLRRHLPNVAFWSD